ncbi:alpha,alpha-trehalase ath1 [Tilletia horrida]|uniref:alpha,alpha-trehalase n=1 Tax=Tilletia horrida TaxID=155126 RepID=A0AAN6G8T6_9BASI|nr:alpha,alpha-trehalase ath1 [Tilletia horrida]
MMLLPSASAAASASASAWLLPLALLLPLSATTTWSAPVLQPRQQEQEELPSSTNGSTTNTSALPDFNWTLATTTFQPGQWQNQPYVANGYIGARLPAEGMGFYAIPPVNESGRDGTNGWPLFDKRVTASTIASFYDYQNSTLGTNFPQVNGQEVLSLIPTWNSLFLTVSNATYTVGVDPSSISNYEQSLSIRDGIVSTAFSWTPPAGDNNTGNASIRLNYTAIAHRDRPTLGLVRLVASNLPAGAEVVVTDAIDGAGALRTANQSAGLLDDAVIWSSVSPFNVTDNVAWLYSALELGSGNDTSSETNAQQLGARTTIPDSVTPSLNTTSNATIAQSYTLTVPASGELVLTKYVGIASGLAFAPNENSTALETAESARQTGWDQLVSEHRAAWDSIWADGGDVVIHADTNDTRRLQQSVRASIFHLLANVREGKEGKGLGDNSIAPAGLTSDSYAGAIFWDAETWMYPGLLALYPSFAESINNYRTRLLDQAVRNAQTYSQPGLLYPWTSYGLGVCSGTGPCVDYEYHLNADIAIAQWQYYEATGNQTWLRDQGWPIIRDVARMFASFVQPGPNGTYFTSNLTDPNEYSNHVKNGAFTNAAISVTLRYAQQAAGVLGLQNETSSNWTSIAENITILKSNGSVPITIESEGLDGSIFNGTTAVKQADVVLLQYPLEFPTADPLADLDYYSMKTDPNGPAMTSSIHSIVAAELSVRGCESFTYLLAAVDPYLRAPYDQFSEQQIDEYAQNGGTNPAYTFLTGAGGYLQTWTHGFTGYRSRPDRLYLNPSLPPQLAPEGYTVKGLRHQGHVLDITVSGQNTTIAHVSGSGELRIEIGGTYATNLTSTSGSTSSVQTRRIDRTGMSNLAQCQSASANATTTPSGFAIAAIDGSNATSWVPATTEPAALLIDLGQEREVVNVHLNFGENPARSVSILLGGASPSPSSSNSTSSSSSSSNSTSSPSPDTTPELQTALQSVAVNISAPYNASTAELVQIVAGNTSDFALPANSRARFVQVVVEGAYLESESGAGATVAEVIVT